MSLGIQVQGIQKKLDSLEELIELEKQPLFKEEIAPEVEPKSSIPQMPKANLPKQSEPKLKESPSKISIADSNKLEEQMLFKKKYEAQQKAEEEKKAAEEE